MPDARGSSLPPIPTVLVDRHQPVQEDEAPVVEVRFLAGDGAVVAAPASAVWASRLVRDMVSLDEEIPLPNTSADAVAAFVRLCLSSPSSSDGARRVAILAGRSSCRLFADATDDEILDLLWVAKLLDMYHVLFAGVAEELKARASLVHKLPAEFCFAMVLNFSEEMTAELLVDVFPRLTCRSGQLALRNKSVRLLLQFLTDHRKPVRDAALRAMLDSDTSEAMAILLEHRDYVVRSDAIRHFRQCTPSDEWVSLVARLASNGSFLVREAVAKALKEIAPQGSELAISALQAMLQDETREVRRAAADGLRHVCHQGDPAVVEFLSKLLSDEAVDEPVRCEALWAFAAIAPDSERETLRTFALTLENGLYPFSKVNAKLVLGMLNRREVSESDEKLPTLFRTTLVEKSWADESDDEGDDDEESDASTALAGSPLLSATAATSKSWADESDDEDEDEGEVNEHLGSPAAGAAVQAAAAPARKSWADESDDEDED